MPTRTVIVGGGLAGLSAAVALSQHDVQVTLVEARARLGGRASSFFDRQTGVDVDNCQHVAMGCCTNFLHLARTVGFAADFRQLDELTFVGPAGEVCSFRPGSLPAPLHLTGAFRQLTYLSSSDRRAILRGLKALVKEKSPETLNGSTADWLQDQRQPSAAIKCFWEVVLVSALSETLDRIALSAARKVFVDGFLSHRDGWRVWVSAVPLQQLYGERFSSWLADRGAEVRLQSPVREILVADGMVQGVRLEQGEELAADHVVLAVPHYRVNELLPPPVREDAVFTAAERIEAAPITSLHLWFDRPITPLPSAVLIDRLSQWVFNRTALADADGNYYQVVISASRHLQQRSREEITQEVLRELGAVWPAAQAARLVHSRFITEARAVFSVRPGTEELRPEQQSPIPNLQLAGDWTQTGWPSTMEGAVRSGYLSAENILRQLGRPVLLLQPDLPQSLLSKILLGL